MGINMCVECNKRPVHVKKWEVCTACYQKIYRRGKVAKVELAAHKREMLFVKNYFNHNQWSYQPAIFQLDEAKYTPDFYDRKENVFIEVCGSRQAYHKNLDKYKMFSEYFPGLKLEFRAPSGELLDEKRDGELWKEQNKS